MTDAGCEMDQTGIQHPKDKDFKFSEFAVKHFQYGEDHVYTDSPIRKSLLPLESVSDHLAALAVSVNILGFMGDLRLAEKYTGSEKITGYRPIMSKILSTLGREFDETDLEGAKMMNIELARQIRDSKTGGKMKRTKFPSMRETTTTESEQIDPSKRRNALLVEMPVTELEQLQFIAGHGILRPCLRDEIYCQIMKQLTQNPSADSAEKGWGLMALCLGCFSPSEKLIPYFESFIRLAPHPFHKYCEDRFKRTFAKRARSQPPALIELEAVQSKTALKLRITLMDGSTRTLNVDSAVTSDEICQQLSDKIGLEDRFGFSLFIAMDDKVTSLGSGSDHVFDAISHCEQFAKAKGMQTENNQWRLFFKKEIFAPWHDPSHDLIATNLIYQQIVRGIKFVEYSFDRDDELAMIVAHQYLIDYGEYGSSVNSESLKVLIPSYIPRKTRNKEENREEALRYWSQLIYQKIRESGYSDKTIEPNEIKGEIVSYAKDKWQRSFSRYFEAYKSVEQGLPKNDVVIAVNSSGVCIVDDQELILVELAFAEINSVFSGGKSEISSSYIQLNTVAGYHYFCLSTYSEDIRHLITTVLEGLKKRSIYAVALRNYSPGGDVPSSLSFRQGDLILLELPNGGDEVNSGWFFGECARNSVKGYIPSQYIYVIPTITKPTQELLSSFVKTEDQKVSDNEELIDGIIDPKPHTLEKYAESNFRSAQKRSLLQRVPSFRRRQHCKIWQFSSETISQPLLKHLVDKGVISEEACSCFSSLQQYMGSRPLNGQDPCELVAHIVATPLRRKVLKDEIYCQIIKQLTDNPKATSEERGWDVLWLVTGCFIPSSDLFVEVKAFLRSRCNLVSQTCIQRLMNTFKYGERKFPPLKIEVEAVQQKLFKVFIQFYFPNDSFQTFEVDSHSRAKDLCRTVSDTLKLKSYEGFSLYIKIGNKVISVPESGKFLDFLSYIIEYSINTTRYGTVPEIAYQVFFLKTLWTNTVPGCDKKADLVFHYHQELPKLLQGFHKCSQDEAARLAALIYRSKFEEAISSRNEISRIVQDIVPTDLFKAMAADEWTNERDIFQHYQNYCNLSQEDAKLEFLKLIHKWPLFGSAFYEIKPLSEPKFPDTLFMAINHKGVHLIETNTKHICSSYLLTMISNWRGSETHFNLTIGDSITGRKINFQTRKGNEIDDVLSAYMKQMLHVTNENKEAG